VSDYTGSTVVGHIENLTCTNLKDIVPIGNEAEAADVLK
jgi:hypothetical protein